MLCGFDVRRVRERSAPRLVPVAQRLAPRARLIQVVGDQLRMALRRVREPRLQCMRHRCMQLFAPLSEQAAVGGLAQQPVSEGVLVPAMALDEAGGLQAPECVEERRARPGAERLEQLQ